MMVRKPGFSRTLVTALAFCLTNLSACTTASPKPFTFTDGIPVDSMAIIDVSPVDYGDQRAVTAVFGRIQAGRRVVLQRSTSSGWQEVATGTQDAYGEVEFLTTGKKDTFRAVAPAATLNGAALGAIATPEGTAGRQWTTAMSTDFSGEALNKRQWKPRGTGSYAASGRHCAAQYPSNIKVVDGKVELSVTQETNQENIAKAKGAGCEADLVLRNAMISTSGLLTFRTGLAAARVRFPETQGLRGGFWLQSAGTTEIELVNSFGYGRGLTSVLVDSRKRYPASEDEATVLTDEVKDRAWWSEYHVYSVEWTNTEVIFRIDGQLTRRIDRTIADLDYYPVIGLLSPDSDQPLLRAPTDAADARPVALPQSMSVDWVKVWYAA